MSCRPVCLVSSTPHLVRKKRLPDISYNVSNVISPITQPVESETDIKCYVPVLSKPKNGTTAPAKSKTYKRTAKKKNTESASSEVLRELNEKDLAVNTALSQSRNMYNMYPELVVLDSDEEDVFPTIDNKTTPIRKPKEAVKISRAKKLKKTNDEEAMEAKCEKGQKLDELPQKTRVLRSRIPEPIKDEAPLNEFESKKRKLTQIKNENGVESKKQGAIRKKKCEIPQNPITSVVCLDDESIFSDCLLPGNLSCKTKKKILEISQLVNAIGDEDIVQWTPRSRKIEQKVHDKEHLDENKNDLPTNKPRDPKSQDLKINQITCDRMENDIKLDNKVVGNKASDDKLPKDQFSCFNNIVFKHNRGSGGLVSNCLQTDKLKFGYVEVEKGQTFTGQCSNVTFVLLEGQVEAVLSHTTQAMSPGDMLRINTDSGYKFKNTSTGHVRFLFVREK